MAGDLGDLYARLKLDTSSLDQAIVKTKGLGGMLKLGFAAAGAAVLAVGVIATDMAAKFQSSTDLMAAQAGITAAQAKLIGAAFLSTSGQVTFSAQTLMDAFARVAGQLATVNGHALNAAESLRFMRSAMDLAEASGQPLADVTANLAGALQAFQLKASDAAASADILFNVSRRLAMPIDTVTSAFEKLHTKLGPIGGTLPQIATLFEDLTTHGLSGSRALLSVAAAADHLLAPSKAIAAELKALHLHLYTASGNFVGMGNVIAELAPKLEGHTQQWRKLVEDTLLGKGAFDKFDATIMAGLPGWDAASAAATKLGTAHKGAVTATDNFKGSLDRIKASLSDAAIVLGQKLLPYVEIAAKWFAQNLPGALKDTIATIQAVSNVVGAVVGVIAKVIGAINAVFGAGGAIDKAFRWFEGVAKTVFGAVGGFIGDVVKVIESIVNAIKDVINWLGKLGSATQKANFNPASPHTSGVAMPTGARASGGPVFPGLGYIVGERGPEFFSPRVPGSIIPNGSSSHVTNNVYVYVTNPGASADEIARKVSWALKTAAT